MKKIMPLILILFLSATCGPKKERVEKIIEDGVEVVINHLEPYKIKGEPSVLNLEEELIVDFESQELAELGITEISWFDVDSEGSIYFSCPDREENQIFKFDKNGKFGTSFGTKGQGPGDINRLTYFRINELDEIIISDDRKKLCLFDVSGNLIKEVNISPNYRMSTLLENGNIIVMKEDTSQFAEKGFATLPIVLCNSSLEEISILHGGQKVFNRLRAERLNGLQTYINRFLWSISKSLIYIGNEENGYEFLVQDTEGKLLKKIRKEYKPVKVSNTVKEKVMKLYDNPRSKELKIPDKVYFPENMPPFQYFFTDDEGRLFVMTHEKGERPKEFNYDIFNPEGVFIGRISLDNSGNEDSAVWGGPFEARAKNKRLYYMRVKESGYQELVVYKMKWE